MTSVHLSSHRCPRSPGSHQACSPSTPVELGSRFVPSSLTATSATSFSATKCAGQSVSSRRTKLGPSVPNASRPAPTRRPMLSLPKLLPGPTLLPRRALSHWATPPLRISPHRYRRRPLSPSPSDPRQLLHRPKSSMAGQRLKARLVRVSLGPGLCLPGLALFTPCLLRMVTEDALVPVCQLVKRRFQSNVHRLEPLLQRRRNVQHPQRNRHARRRSLFPRRLPPLHPRSRRGSFGLLLNLPSEGDE